MVMMSYDDENNFLSVCVAIASQIHKFFICEAIASSKKWFLVVASQDFTNL